MSNNKLELLTFSDIPDTVSPHIIKNFIISNGCTRVKDLSLNYSFSFEGMVFAICLKGSGKLKISFREYLFEENSIIILLPSQIVEILNHTEDLALEFLAFSPDFLSDLAIPKNFDVPYSIAQMPVVRVSTKETQNLLRYHSFITETFTNKNHKFLDQIVKGLLYSLLLEVSTIYIERYAEKGEELEKNFSRSEKITEQFLLLLRAHYKERRTAAYYADKMHITPKYLSSILKRVTGRTVNTWIEEVITMHAKLLLKSSDHTVLQISEELNFPNPSYFGRFFKKNTKMTPREYRES